MASCASILKAMRNYQILDRFLPPDARIDALERMRWRIVVGFLLLNAMFLFLLNLIVALRAALAGQGFNRIHVILIPQFFAYLISLVFYRRMKRPQVAAHLIVGMNYLLISLLALITGSEASRVFLQLLYVIAILPFLLIGVRAGIAWGLLGGLTYASIDGLRMIGALPEGQISAESFMQLNPLFLFAVYPTLFATGLIYESLNRRQARQLIMDRNRFMDQANRDHLTGLANRLQLEIYFPMAVDQAAEDGEMLAVLYIDLNDFKPINDTFGHTIGDLVLQNIAARMRETVRDSDLAVRLGGDEFAVIYRHLRSPEGAVEAARNLLARISGSMIIQEREMRVGASAGIVVYPHHSDDAENLIDLADACMYQAKTRNISLYVFPGEREEMYPAT
jgi:diguanylate cyclase (GGDEF)-like protein